MPEGVVKWYSAAKHYGFITRDDGVDLFVHESRIQNREPRELVDGERVRFDVWQGSRGPMAINVREPDPPPPAVDPDGGVTVSSRAALEHVGQ